MLINPQTDGVQQVRGHISRDSQRVRSKEHLLPLHGGGAQRVDRVCQHRRRLLLQCSSRRPLSRPENVGGCRRAA